MSMSISWHFDMVLWFYR